MLGFMLAFAAAASKSTADLFAKKGLGKTDEYVVAFSLRFFSIPFLVAVVLYTGIPALNATFFAALFSSSVINLAAQILYMKAIKSSPLSLTIPFLSFAPIFMLVTAYLVFGELPGTTGIAGVFIVTAGAYILNIKNVKKGILNPLAAIVKEKGSRYMVTVAFLYSLSSNFDKMAINNSSPLFYAFSINLALSFLLLPVMMRFSKNHRYDFKKHALSFLPVGFFTALASLAQYTAFTMIFLVYISAIKRTSSLMSIIYGKYFLGEDNIKQRLLGASVMIIGVLMITLL